jgi:hypothetical protein
MRLEPTRSDLELSEEAERIVQEGRVPAPRRMWHQGSSWRAIEARIHRQRRPQTAVLICFALSGYAALAIMAAGIHVDRSRLGGVKALPSAAWREIDLGPVGRLSLAPGARIRLPTPEPKPEDPYRVTLDEGQLCAQVNHRDPLRQRPFEVDAPDLKVIVVGTRFCVFAGSEPSWVAVEEGRVQVQGGADEAVFVAAGECLQANDPRLVRAPVPSPGVVASIAPMEAPSPRGITRRAPSPAPRQSRDSNGLSLENAAYESGLRAIEAHRGAEALAVWEDYRQRFPQGVFGAEVDLYRLRELAAEGRAVLALSAADEFAREHPADWRRPEEELIRADVLREQLHQPAQSLPIYERLIASERQASLSERAFYGLCMSERALSRRVEAAARFRQYLQRFPDGQHRDEVERLLTSE